MAAALAVEVLAAAGGAVYAWDLASDAVAWAGEAPPAPTGAAWRALVHPEDRARRDAALAAHRADGTAFDCDYRLCLPDGTVRRVSERGRVEHGGDGAPCRMRGLLQDAGAAHRDSMTGLPDRRRLRDALAKAMGGGAPAYLAIGIDRLGLVNEAIGHAAADAVVVEVARRIAGAVRGGDTVGRLGGDLFGVLLPHCPEAFMPRVAQTLLSAVRAEPVATPAGPVHVTVSIGGLVAGGNGAGDGAGDAATAMTRAETALQEAKRQGRDGFWPHAAISPQQGALRAGMPMVQRVRAALHGGDLHFAFQPVVEAAGGVAFYECLLRITGADGGTQGGTLTAGDFMPAVERLGMARRLDHHTLAMAVRELEAHPEVRLAVNMSAATTTDGSWLAALHGMIGGRTDMARRLIVEITETAAIEDLEETARFVGIVRALGCRVALDDFGAGYLSYRHLKALPVDIVKIDGSFVQEMERERDALLFIRSVLGLAEGFGLTTVAEGVESAGHAAALRHEGVRLLQGHHFGAPSLERPWMQSVGPEPVGLKAARRAAE
ncbi:EAL domain-containing protein [Azospirillum sp.]|uniref:EAL domain-containing protein n=1 Tax=Azospirillum sp. TaxID=34012 RepID=UPI002D76DC0F|nr:EAL domain-containing protein [Azospirillum sp.]